MEQRFGVDAIGAADGVVVIHSLSITITLITSTAIPTITGVVATIAALAIGKLMRNAVMPILAAKAATSIVMQSVTSYAKTWNAMASAVAIVLAIAVDLAGSVAQKVVVLVDKTILEMIAAALATVVAPDSMAAVIALAVVARAPVANTSVAAALEADAKKLSKFL